MREYKRRNLGIPCMICVVPDAVYNVATERFREFQQEYDPKEEKYSYFTFSDDPPYAWEIEKDAIIAAVKLLVRAHLEQRKMGTFNEIHFPYFNEHSVWTSDIDFSVVISFDDPAPIDSLLITQLQVLLANHFESWRIRILSKDDFDIVIYPEFICVGDRPLSEVIDDQLADWIDAEAATWEQEYAPLRRQLDWIKANCKLTISPPLPWSFIKSFDKCLGEPKCYTHWIVGKSEGFQTPILYDGTTGNNVQLSRNIHYPILEDGSIGCRYTPSPIDTRLVGHAGPSASPCDLYVAISNSTVTFPPFRVNQQDIIKDEDLFRQEAMRKPTGL